MSIQSGIIQAFQEININSDKGDKYTGIWVEDKKIASIGVAVKNWITFHGAAINLNTNLDDFKKEYRADAKDTMDRIASLENTRSNAKGFIILFSKISFPVALVVLAAYMGSYYSSSNKTPQVTVEKKIDTK